MPSPPVTRREFLILLGVVLLGAGLRLAHPGRMAVEHFDEGVYASNVWFDETQGFRYPAQHLYAPPLLPTLIEWAFIGQILVGGEPSDFAAMLPSLVAGILMIPLVWWVGREWFGPAAGIAAATLCSLSDFHALFSRTALTDVLLSFWLLLAVYLIWRAYLARQLPWMIAAGIATGLAWWTKYNGWLPLAIGLAGLIPWLIFNSRTGTGVPPVKPTARPKHRRDAGPTSVKQTSPLGYLGIWCGIAVIALIVWSPVWFGLQDKGGYAAVAANHRQYVVGLSGWFDSAVRQLTNLDYLTSWPTGFSLGGAFLFGGVGFLGLPFVVRSGWRAAAIALGALTGAAVLLGMVMNWCQGATLGILTVVGVLWNALVPFGSRESGTMGGEQDQRSSLALWLLAAWFCGLLVATPFYRPYPRLVLPWLMACSLGAGLWIQTCFAWKGREHPAGGEVRRLIVDPVFVAMLAICTLMALRWKIGPSPTDLPPAWQSRTDLERIAGEIIEETRRIAVEQNVAPDEVIVYVYAEPALFFQLKQAGLPLVGPVQDLEFVAQPPQRPTFLVVGPHAEDSTIFAEQWTQRSESFQRVARWEYHPSDLVLLDEDVMPQRGERRVEPITIYRVTSDNR